MKIYVDEMPDDPINCLFHHFDFEEQRCMCILDDNYQYCNYVSECPYLKVLEEKKHE